MSGPTVLVAGGLCLLLGGGTGYVFLYEVVRLVRGTGRPRRMLALLAASWLSMVLAATVIVCGATWGAT